VDFAYASASTKSETRCPPAVPARSGFPWQPRQSLFAAIVGYVGFRVLCGWWQSTHTGILFGSLSHSLPSITFRWTRSICAWHCRQVFTRFAGWMLDFGSSWGRISCDVWHVVQTAVTTRPFWKSPSPCMPPE
jgi:hypothetical protein